MAQMEPRYAAHADSQWPKYFGRVGLFMLAIVLMLLHTDQVYAATGQSLFNQHCMQCHTIGGGRLVGPDLKDITSKRKDDWLLKFIKSPQKMIAENDATAKSLVVEYKMVMPDQALSDAEIQSIMAYISQASAGAMKAPKQTAHVQTAMQPSSVSVKAGAMLFTGETRFANGGAACISCHDVQNAEIGISGGRLAVNLTHIYGNLGAAGIKSMITTPPFTPMAAAYSHHAITDAEGAQLIDFLQSADTGNADKGTTQILYGMLIAGGAGLLAILWIMNLIWSGRKRLSTKDKIYTRQIETR